MNALSCYIVKHNKPTYRIYIFLLYMRCQSNHWHDYLNSLAPNEFLTATYYKCCLLLQRTSLYTREGRCNKAVTIWPKTFILRLVKQLISFGITYMYERNGEGL